MKIGVTQIILGKMSLDDTLDLCQEAGYDAIELVFSPDKDLNVEMSDQELKTVGDRCAQAGVTVTSVIAQYAERGNLLSRDQQQRAFGRRAVERSLQIASVLEAGATLLHPGQLTSQGTYDEAWDDLCDVLRSLASTAENAGVAIGLENVWNKFMLSPREAVQLVDEVGSEWVGIYLDTANMMAYGHPEQWIRALGSRIKRVHVKDFDRSGHAFVELLDGDAEWPTIMSELRAADYDVSLIHEVSGDRAVQIRMGERLRRIVAL
jgi:L-ribulose-5-phosphate 3-epimerase